LKRRGKCEETLENELVKNNVEELVQLVDFEEQG
jgi:hypothetical protein